MVHNTDNPYLGYLREHQDARARAFATPANALREDPDSDWMRQHTVEGSITGPGVIVETVPNSNEGYARWEQIMRQSAAEQAAAKRQAELLKYVSLLREQPMYPEDGSNAGGLRGVAARLGFMAVYNFFRRSA